MTNLHILTSKRQVRFVWCALRGSYVCAQVHGRTSQALDLMERCDLAYADAYVTKQLAPPRIVFERSIEPFYGGPQLFTQANAFHLGQVFDLLPKVKELRKTNPLAVRA